MSSASSIHPAASTLRIAAWPAWLSGALAAIVYIATADTRVGFHDSAELALRAAQLGATHAPGAPLHTLLGFLFIQPAGDPAAATAWLSVAAGVAGVALTTRALLLLGLNNLLALAGGLAFAFLYPVWGNAVVTELYALSVLCVAIATGAALTWLRDSEAGYPLLMTVACMLAMAAHFANILVIPAFALLFVLRNGWRHPGLPVFLAMMLLAVIGIAFANAALAARVPPFGDAVPDSVGGIISYMSGAEHDPLARRSPSELLARVGAHALIFVRHYWYAGLALVLVGAAEMLRGRSPAAWLLMFIFLAYMGYFTLFGSGDYFLMVGPAYFVASIWLSLGAAALYRLVRGRASPAAGAALLPGLLAILALSAQFGDRYRAAQSSAAEAYAREAFAALPVNAVAVARWNEFTALRYEQFVSGLRPDVTLLLPARSRRHYHFGEVNDYIVYLTGAVCERPVLTNTLTEEIEAGFDAESLPASGRWKQLRPARSGGCREEG